MSRLWIVALIPLFLMQCSDADTLGDEPPIEVSIQGSLIYTNGIDELLQKKCAWCHAFPLPPLAPDNIVDNLDLTRYETRLEGEKVIRGADAIGSWIHQGILSGPVAIFDATSNPRQMPLDYATPLTSTEITALRDWSELGSPKDEHPDPAGDAGRGQPFYSGLCATCHGSDGSGVSFNEIWIGPPLRPTAVTVAKIKSMWLDKIYSENFQLLLEDADAEGIRAYILEQVLTKQKER